MNGVRAAVVGATGMVGRELVRLLEERRLPLSEASFFASGGGAASLSFRGRSRPVRPASAAALLGFDLAFFAAEETVAKRLAPLAARAGTTVIDESSAFRMDPKVPLVIPEINASALSAEHRLIAGPNCTTAALLMGIYPIHRANPILSIRAATYQAVSGAGRAAVEEFSRQVLRWSRNQRWAQAHVLPRPLAFNLFPQIGAFDREGRSAEEAKLARETRKILGAPGLRVSATAVRVPVFRGHSLAVSIETQRGLSPRRAVALLAAADGVKLLSADGQDYPTPLLAAGKAAVFVGRVRRGGNPRELLLWIVGDNLLKGAALNSVQIAEHLLRKGWLRPRRSM